MTDTAKNAEALLAFLRKNHLTLSAAESLTGGLLSSFFTEIPGSSDTFKGGAVTYCNELKEHLIGVPADILNRYGAVSAECARAMAQGVRNTCSSDVGISLTGIAGPASDESGAPVGLVFAGCSFRGTTIAKKLQLSGSRQEIRIAACLEAMRLIREQTEQLLQEAGIEDR